MGNAANPEFPPPPAGRAGWPWTAPASSEPSAPDGVAWPLISVVIPLYNKVEFVEATLRSVLLQRYPATEVIVVDAESTDGSLDIVRRYERWLSAWVSEPDRGQSDAVNKGVRRASGELVFWINADDLALPGSFATAATAYLQADRPDVVVGQALRIDRQGRELGRTRSRFTSWSDYATRKCTIRQVAAFFRRQALLDVGLLDVELRYSMDRDLLLRLTRQRDPIVLDEALAAFRMYAEQQFNGNPVPGYIESDRVTDHHLAGTPWLAEYRRWSAYAWLGRTREPDLGPGDRLRCALRGLTRSPGVVLVPEFWARLVGRGNGS